MRQRPLAAQLIARELLDNSERIATAQTRPLEQFLTTALTLIADAQATGHARRDMPPLALLTVTLGSLNYAHMARPTFARAFDHPPLHEPAKWMRAEQPAAVAADAGGFARSPNQGRRGKCRVIAHSAAGNRAFEGQGHEVFGRHAL